MCYRHREQLKPPSSWLCQQGGEPAKAGHWHTIQAYNVWASTPYGAPKPPSSAVLQRLFILCKSEGIKLCCLPHANFPDIVLIFSKKKASSMLSCSNIQIPLPLQKPKAWFQSCPLNFCIQILDIQHYRFLDEQNQRPHHGQPHWEAQQAPSKRVVCTYVNKKLPKCLSSPVLLSTQL